MFVDSHCHLNLMDYDALGMSVNDVIHHATEAQVEHLLCVATTLESAEDILALTKQFSIVSGSVGVHPNEVGAEPSTQQLVDLAEQPKMIAIGETGLDYYRSDNTEQQIARFVTHIDAAKQTQKPLIVHTRAAKKETVSVLRSENASEPGGVIHCFTEDWEMAQAVLDLGFYLSFSGIVTFKNAHVLQEVAKKTPLDRLLIETDSPYLAPVPYRGKINQPAYVTKVAEFIATLKGIPLAELAAATTANFYQLFFHNRSKHSAL